ncbi:MAG: Lrp/AsnC family transcriptional regulator, partial [Canibacter sp.]
MSTTRQSPALDAISKQIIEQLQLDGRKSYAEIAKVVGLSEAAVRQRVQKLTDAGITQIVAVTDPMKLGFERLAMIGIRVSGDTRTVANRLADMPE